MVSGRSVSTDNHAMQHSAMTDGWVLALVHDLPSCRIEKEEVPILALV